ncbi:MAG TPA: AAA-like domain-containing protein [Chthonomonadaceae bacterium]|nr:AAA-like domain-containing protein [Chthonomonadaceae bacterium]
MLVLYAGRDVARDYLAGLLWPESGQSQAFYSLRRCLADLRQALGSEASRLKSPTPQTLCLDLAGAFVDVLAFDSAIARKDTDSLAEAVGLYRGPLLEGCAEEWVVSEREAREQAYLHALETLAAHAMARDDPGGAVRTLRRAVAVDALREGAQRALMQALAAGGEYAAAVLVYRDLRLLLQREMNLSPAPETTALFQQIRAEAQRRAQNASRSVAATITEAAQAPPDSISFRQSEPDLDITSLSLYDPILAIPLESVGGAVPLDSPFYITRPVDERFHAAIARRDSIVLVKGARQVGKTSLLARGLQRAREAGIRVVLTDFQALPASALASSDSLLRILAADLADGLHLDIMPEDSWNDRRTASRNLERYLGEVALGMVLDPVVWAMDEVDRLFAYDYGSEVFGLFRSWHNRRALDPTGPWMRLTLALAYSTEAHLFIADRNQSPFNVGLRLTIEDFTPAQVTELNRRYGAPLRNAREEARFDGLVNGHPFLAHRGLAEMASRRWGIEELEAQADREDGPFGDHLRHILDALSNDAEIKEAVRSVLQNHSCVSSDCFFRLRSAGLLTGDSREAPRFRCGIYQTFLARCLL